jgi:hypothetical protein
MGQGALATDLRSTKAGHTDLSRILTAGEPPSDSRLGRNAPFSAPLADPNGL